MSTAFIFPGQGGQFIGQGQSWLEKDPSLKEVFDLADEISGRPISELSFQGPMEDLSKTANLQPAVLAVCLAGLRLMKRQAKPDFVAGHSLGEFGALVAADVLDEKTALKLVCKRAVIMDETAAANPGAMTAVMGVSEQDLAGICELAANEGPVVMANFNTPDQIVISGAARAVAAATKYIKLKNGKAIGLPVSGGFHSELMAAAAERFAQEIEKTEFKEPTCPVLPNATARPTTEAAEIKKILMSQITSPVRWSQTVSWLAENGVDRFIEAWPKAYLASMTKKCLPKGTEIKVEFQA